MLNLDYKTYPNKMNKNQPFFLEYMKWEKHLLVVLDI